MTLTFSCNSNFLSVVFFFIIVTLYLVILNSYNYAFLFWSEKETSVDMFCGAQTGNIGLSLACIISCSCSHFHPFKKFVFDLQILKILQNKRVGLNKQDNPLLVFILIFFPQSHILPQTHSHIKLCQIEPIRSVC